ncbi:hypothetical protein Tsubulata_044841 [Turnera subulata]|uniref:CG-1 domain-containing protein n=1 Tax=Turnera subulata TaxID=218843 RepID=A0A9Q0FG85_9ROSI|nr:hypothetical protein Tsubulata_044841 [Turnera subulata]
MWMADNRRHLSSQNQNQNQTLCVEQILQDAKHRWLRPTEILEILRNYQRFQLTPEPPVTPPAGSMFLFDRKSLRYFRKDGHRWKKKKDGKTVREAHEKLKAGSVDVLHCYYAHGEDNENFQRRSYWMLDGQLEHIVLVHYREVKEGYRSAAACLVADASAVVENLQPSAARTASPTSTAPISSYTSIQNRTDWNRQTLSSEYKDVDSKNGPVTSSPGQQFHVPMSHNAAFLAPEVEGLPVKAWSPPEICSSSHNSHLFVGRPEGADGDNAAVIGNRLITKAKAPPQMVIQEHDLSLIPPKFSNYSGPQVAAVSSAEFEKGSKHPQVAIKELGELKKLDSFGRWMDKELGGDCEDSLMASDSGNFWNALGAENDDKEVSSLSHHMQLDIDSLGPSLSQEQLFSICDFSPDWAYIDVGAKVLIIGTFLGSKKSHAEAKWGCMFGEMEVCAEVLTDNVIRCQAPPHVSGRVPFYVTCRNRFACSEVREFEYRVSPSRIPSLSAKKAPEEEMHFQIRLTKLLYLGQLVKWLNCSIDGCNSCKLRTTFNTLRKDCKKHLKRDSMVAEGNCMDPRDKLIESLLEDRLCEWLICKVHEGEKGPDVLDDEGQGVIHLAAGLGYEWAMGFIVAASGNPNFRDARGRTALHWASYFGREETVISLVRLAVDPTAVDDPTPAFPGGQTAADLACSQGHKGIAGYLAEAFLTKHLSTLNIKQNEMNSAAAAIAADKAAESAAQLLAPTDRGVDEQLSLRGSLAAVRKSAHAAALILVAYRASSFRQRQLAKKSDDVSEVSSDVASVIALNMVQKRGNFEDYLHSAAVRIQQKYRGWKGRQEFLRIRNRIVKLQAHVRGHQVRKQYKKVVWSVSILEKAILRWRRKRSGLRGFRSEKEVGDMLSGTEKTDEYEFLRIGRKQKFAGVENALARVTSMVRNPEARDQYMRMVTEFGTQGNVTFFKNILASKLLPKLLLFRCMIKKVAHDSKGKVHDSTKLTGFEV